jgi:hypothetical protein
MSYLDIFTVKDSKAEAYLQPFFVHNEAVALRIITNLVEDDGHQFGKNPEDYSLWFLGKYDESTGELINMVDKKHICNLSDLKRPFVAQSEVEEM